MEVERERGKRILFRDTFVNSIQNRLNDIEKEFKFGGGKY